MRFARTATPVAAVAGAAAPVAIGDISDLVTTVDGTEISLTFTPATNATSHEFRAGTVNPPDGAWTALTENPMATADFADETEIFFQVRGVAGASVGNASNVDSVTTPAIYGPELVTNGTFDSATTGWTASTSTLSAVGGRMRVQGATGGGGLGRADQTISGLTPGDTLRFTCAGILGTSPSVGIRVKQDSTAGANLFSQTNANAVDTTFVVPASGTVVIQCLELNSSTSDYGSFDDISLRKVLNP
jgi:hypothetical protein